MITALEVQTPAQASLYLKINDGLSDGLKKSRKTGKLWGYPAPKFIKAKHQVLYHKSDLDDFLGNIPRYRSSKEAEESRKLSCHLVTLLPFMLYLRRSGLLFFLDVIWSIF